MDVIVMHGKPQSLPAWLTKRLKPTHVSLHCYPRFYAFFQIKTKSYHFLIRPRSVEHSLIGCLSVWSEPGFVNVKVFLSYPPISCRILHEFTKGPWGSDILNDMNLVNCSYKLNKRRNIFGGFKRFNILIIVLGYCVTDLYIWNVLLLLKNQ